MDNSYTDYFNRESFLKGLKKESLKNISEGTKYSQELKNEIIGQTSTDSQMSDAIITWDTDKVEYYIIEEFDTMLYMVEFVSMLPIWVWNAEFYKKFVENITVESNIKNLESLDDENVHQISNSLILYSSNEPSAGISRPKIIWNSLYYTLHPVNPDKKQVLIQIKRIKRPVESEKTGETSESSALPEIKILVSRRQSERKKKIDIENILYFCYIHKRLEVNDPPIFLGRKLVYQRDQAPTFDLIQNVCVPNLEYFIHSVRRQIDVAFLNNYEKLDLKTSPDLSPEMNEVVIYANLHYQQRWYSLTTVKSPTKNIFEEYFDKVKYLDDNTKTSLELDIDVRQLHIDVLPSEYSNSIKHNVQILVQSSYEYAEKIRALTPNFRTRTKELMLSTGFLIHSKQKEIFIKKKLGQYSEEGYLNESDEQIIINIMDEFLSPFPDDNWYSYQDQGQNELFTFVQNYRESTQGDIRRMMEQIQIIKTAGAPDAVMNLGSRQNSWVFGSVVYKMLFNIYKRLKKSRYSDPDSLNNEKFLLSRCLLKFIARKMLISNFAQRVNLSYFYRLFVYRVQMFPALKRYIIDKIDTNNFMYGEIKTHLEADNREYPEITENISFAPFITKGRYLIMKNPDRISRYNEKSENAPVSSTIDANFLLKTQIQSLNKTFGYENNILSRIPRKKFFSTSMTSNTYFGQRKHGRDIGRITILSMDYYADTIYDLPIFSTKTLYEPLVQLIDKVSRLQSPIAIWGITDEDIYAKHSADDDSVELFVDAKFVEKEYDKLFDVKNEQEFSWDPFLSPELNLLLAAAQDTDNLDKNDFELIKYYLEKNLNIKNYYSQHDHKTPLLFFKSLYIDENHPSSSQDIRDNKLNMFKKQNLWWVGFYVYKVTEATIRQKMLTEEVMPKIIKLNNFVKTNYLVEYQNRSIQPVNIG